MSLLPSSMTSEAPTFPETLVDSDAPPALAQQSSASHSPSEAPVTVIEPKPGWRAIDLAELWRYRELIYFLTWRDVKVRYKQTVMGAAWAVIQPLTSSFVFVLLFGVMGRMRSDTTVPYLPFVFAAQMAWLYFQSAVMQGGQSLVNSANMISKVYFPRLIVPIAAVGAGLVDFAVSLLVMIVMLAIYGLIPPLQVFLLPVMLIGVVTTAVGIGSLLSALTVAYRDFRYVVPFLIQIWMFATPVAYPLQKIYALLDYVGISQAWLPLYFFLNPVAGFVQGFRWCLFDEPLSGVWFAASACSAALWLVVGAVYFRSVERRFADIV